MERGQLIRLRALGDPAVGSEHVSAPVTLSDYHRAVQAALAASHGCAPRPIIESIAASVINAVYNKRQITQANAAALAQTDG